MLLSSINMRGDFSARDLWCLIRTVYFSKEEICASCTGELVDAVSSTEDRLHFGSTATSDEQSPEDSSPQVIDKMDERWSIRFIPAWILD